ncbi:MAG: thioredoxin [Magnetospirillum sp.]|nr:MAG: thioredoxin [Magnetospirillum sp.]
MAASAKLGDDGLYVQDWFVNSFLDLREDLADAAKSGKRFAIIWEQKGCAYCRDLHTVNFADDKLRGWVRDRYAIVQLNLWGSREVTDFDGEVLAEKDLARKYRINFTPTTSFFPETVAEMGGRKGGDAEVARMPGYFRNFHFLSMFEYVWDKRYARGQEFQRYLAEKMAAQPGAAQ